MTGKHRHHGDIPAFDENAHDARKAALRFNGLTALPDDLRLEMARLHSDPPGVAFAALEAWKEASRSEASERQLRAEALAEARQAVALLCKALATLNELDAQPLGAQRRAALASYRTGQPFAAVEVTQARIGLQDALALAQVECDALAGTRGKQKRLLRLFAEELLPLWQKGGTPAAGEHVASFTHFVCLAAEIATEKKPDQEAKKLARFIALEIAPRP